MPKFNQVAEYVNHRLLHWLYRRGGQRWRVKSGAWPLQRFLAMVLYRLQGTVCKPAHTTQRGSSVSRVPEMGTQDSIEDAGTGPARWVPHQHPPAFCPAADQLDINV